MEPPVFDLKSFDNALLVSGTANALGKFLTSIPTLQKECDTNSKKFVFIKQTRTECPFKF